VTEPGRLIVLAAPSGAGKTTLVRKLLEREIGLTFSVSYTTRLQRKTEADGKDYFFVSEGDFAAMRDRAEFLEYAEVFGNWYGTSEEYVQSLLDAGHSVLLEIDWQGANQVREHRSDAIFVFILPTSCAELEHRLRGRKTDSEEVIQGRLSQALDDMEHWGEFGYVVINDELDIAAAELSAVIAGEGAKNRTDDPEIRTRAEAILASGS
jgi:guanylate kinase